MASVHSLNVLLGVTLVLLVGVAGRARAQDEGYAATIRINLQDKKAPVSPTLYGIFMEEISHAFDGGIYAELGTGNCALERARESRHGGVRLYGPLGGAFLKPRPLGVDTYWAR